MTTYINTDNYDPGALASALDVETSFTQADDQLIALWRAVNAVEVLNTSGATAVVGDVGFINDAGEYKTTTTALLANVAWCVVTGGGANNTLIRVARRGRVTVRYTGTAPSAGHYLTTSTSAGLAQRSTIMRQEIFAACLSAGSGGVVTALLLTGTEFVSLFSSTRVFDASLGHGISAFTSTISGAPTSTSVTYGTILTGNEEILQVGSASMAQLRLWNTTRGTYRLISSVNLGTNVITTTASTDSWANGDALTVESQTTLTGLTEKMTEYEVTDWSLIPRLTRSIQFVQRVSGTTLPSYRTYHPLEAYHQEKQIVYFSQVVSQAIELPVTVPLVGGAFCTRAGTTSGNVSFAKLIGAFVAMP